LSSFLLSLVPVIGPVVLPIPPLLTALAFTSVPTPIFYLVWLLVGEQLVTNVLGPRLQGHSVGIHPLEAMVAALIGYPIAGLLGAFLAVPVAAFLHVVVREAHRTTSSSARMSGSRQVTDDATLPDNAARSATLDTRLDAVRAK
jgi:predicted PurR-regulated permease PerM